MIQRFSRIGSILFFISIVLISCGPSSSPKVQPEITPSVTLTLTPTIQTPTATLMYKIKWSTLAGEYEQKTGFERPIKFINADGSPAALKPGHTWVIIVTPFSTFTEQQGGAYLVRYIPALGEARK